MRESVSDITPFFDYKETIITVNVPASVAMFEANALRAGFIVSNLTAGGPGYITLIQNNRGIFVPPQGSPVFILIQDVGAVTRQKWFATKTGGAPVDFHIFEILYNPQAGRTGSDAALQSFANAVAKG